MLGQSLQTHEKQSSVEIQALLNHHEIPPLEDIGEVWDHVYRLVPQTHREEFTTTFCIHLIDLGANEDKKKIQYKQVVDCILALDKELKKKYRHVMYYLPKREQYVVDRLYTQDVAVEELSGWMLESPKKR